MNNVIESNEIDKLFGLIKVYKKLIISLTMLGIIVSMIYASVIYKPIYPALALIQVGKENGRLIEPMNLLELKLINKYHVNTISKELPKVFKVKIRDTKNGIIRLQAKGYDKEKLSEFLEQKVLEIVKEQNIKFQNFMKKKNEKIALANEMLQKVDDEIKEIKSSQKSSNVALSTLENSQQALINMNLLNILRSDSLLARAYDRRDTYVRELNVGKRQLLTKYTYETKMLDGVSVSDEPMTLSKMMITVLGAVSSFMLSILLVLFLSFLAERKEGN